MKLKAKNKLKCACGNSGYCRRHSKIKMVVMVKEPYINSYPTTVFYSFFKEDKKPQISIIIKMLDRLSYKFRNAYNCILFYDNLANQEIHRHKP